MKTRIKAIIALFLSIQMIVGCSALPLTDLSGDLYVDSDNSTISDDVIVVGVSQLGSESVWRTANTASVQNALSQENGYFAIMNNARQKQENQIKAIRSFISQRVDYIVVAPLLEEGWENTLQEAKDAGIPVILMDRNVSADSSYYTTSVGTDKWAEGENAAKCLESILKKRGLYNREINIVVLEGTHGSSAQLGRTMGFDSIARTHDNWKILERVDAEFTTIKGKEVMKDFLGKYDKVDVVISQNDDMTFGAIEAINEAGYKAGIENDDIIVISFDACHEALELVEKGIIAAEIECNPEQGELISEIIQMLEAGEKVEKEYKVEELVFTKENVSEYIDTRSY